MTESHKAPTPLPGLTASVPGPLASPSLPLAQPSADREGLWPTGHHVPPPDLVPPPDPLPPSVPVPPTAPVPPSLHSTAQYHDTVPLPQSLGPKLPHMKKQQMSMRCPTLKIISWNVGSFDAVRLCKLAGIKERTPDILLLQETNVSTATYKSVEDQLKRVAPGHTFVGSAIPPYAPTPPGAEREERPSLGVGLIYSDRIQLHSCTTSFDDHPTLNHRLLRADITLKGTDVTLTVLSVYAPVEQSAENLSARFYSELSDYLDRFPPEFDLMAGGDWNAIAVAKISKKTAPPPTRLSQPLIKFLEIASLHDVYSHLVESGKPPAYTHTNRGQNATKKDYSCSRRLDCLFVSEPLLEFVRTTVRFANHAGSSHHPVYFSLRFSALSKPVLVGRGTWRLPSWVFSPDYVNRLRETISAALELNAPLRSELRLTTVLQMVQEAIQRDSKERQACLRAECRLDPERTEEIQREALIARSPFDKHVPANESFTAIKTRVKQVRKEANIIELKGPIGDTKYKDTPTMCAIAQLFYKDIYEHKGAPEGEKEFLDAIPQSALKQMKQPDLQEALNAPFTESELWETLKSAQHKSAPGMDGFTYKFYVTFWDQFKDLLLEVFELAAKGTPVSRQRNTSVIRLIPKSGDLSDISNYRPISLINTELKLFTHLINRRMQKTLDFVVHPNQTGFVPERQMTQNLDAMDHYYNVYGQSHKWAVGMLDFRKAYDSISQEWIIAVLEHLGFPARIINSVKSVQAQAASSINIRGVLSGSIRLKSGVRQGCPLSPTLFAIAIDPFIRKLDEVMMGLGHRLAEQPSRPARRKLIEMYESEERLEDGTRTRKIRTTDIAGLRTFLERHLSLDNDYFPVEPPANPQRFAPMVPLPAMRMKVSAFADDVALFMGGPQDVVASGKVICAFAKASKLCLNPSKTVIQVVSHDRIQPDITRLNELLAAYWPSAPPKEPDSPRQYTKAQPSGTLFRYLGIHFGRKDLVDEYYAGFIKDLESQLRSYTLFGLKHHAKAWMLNMFYLSKLIFYLPYVELFNDDTVKRILTACCDKINGRLCGENEGGRRTYKDELIYQPLKAGGIGLRNFVEQAKSLRAARAARFFQNDTPARQHATFLFATKIKTTATTEDPSLDPNPALRLNKIRWFDVTNWHWNNFLSKSMALCLHRLADQSPVARLAEPPFELDPENHTPERRLVELFYLQRLEMPDAPMSQQQLDYLLSQIDVPPKTASAKWREVFTIMKNDHWKETLPPDLDPDHCNWLAANDKLGKHYRAECRSAATLHMLRLSRLPFQRWHSTSDFFAYRDIGCGACRLYKEKDHLHNHLFVECPVVKAFCNKAHVPLPTRMADWVLLEKDGHLHYIRELAHAIWKLERSLRKSGRDGSDPTVQRDLSHLFKRARTAYQNDLPVMAARAAKAP